MPAIRLPQSAEPLLSFCRRSEEPADNACFDTYADLVTFAASCGFYRFQGRRPSDPSEFFPNVYPIDLAVFKNQGLFPNLLLMGLGCEGRADIARDEERLCRLVEAFADAGCKYLAHEMGTSTPARFHLHAAAVLAKVAEDQKQEHI